MDTPYEGGIQPPSAALADFVEVLWYQNIPIYTAREIILPSQYIELIVNFGQPHKVLRPATNPGRPTSPAIKDFELHSTAWLAGLQSRCLTIESQTSHMIGARIKPGGAAALFAAPISDFTDRVVPLAEILGAQAVEALHRELLAAAPGPARFAVLDAFLCRLLHTGRAGFELAVQAVRRIQASAGNLNLEELSSELGVSHKHLIQQFTRIVGLRPKLFARIVRFAGILPALTDRAIPDWAALAQLAGYHDQPHFNRDFQDFAGLSPSKYLELRERYRADYGIDLETEADTRFVPIG